MTKIPKEFLFETCNELYIEKDTRSFYLAHEMNKCIFVNHALNDCNVLNKGSFFRLAFTCTVLVAKPGYTIEDFQITKKMNCYRWLLIT